VLEMVKRKDDPVVLTYLGYGHRNSPMSISASPCTSKLWTSIWKMSTRAIISAKDM
jgi:hypothetical protein